MTLTKKEIYTCLDLFRLTANVNALLVNELFLASRTSPH
jgi:hypothetical protein